MMRTASVIVSLLLSFATPSSAQKTLFDFNAKSIDGKELAFSSFKGKKAVLIVNVASECGYTHTNYKELQELYQRYENRGLAIVAVPCNQFGAQEPGSPADILSFVESRYHVTFPVMEKVEVNGGGEHPIFRFLKTASGDTSPIPWNFSKFLVVEGTTVTRYSHGTNPSEIEEDIVAALELQAQEL